MRTLAQDRDEMDTDEQRRWVERMRRQYGIHSSEATCWFVDVEQSRLAGQEAGDTDTKFLWAQPW